MSRFPKKFPEGTRPAPSAPALRAGGGPLLYMREGSSFIADVRYNIDTIQLEGNSIDTPAYCRRELPFTIESGDRIELRSSTLVWYQAAKHTTNILATDVRTALVALVLVVESYADHTWFRCYDCRAIFSSIVVQVGESAVCPQCKSSHVRICSVDRMAFKGKNPTTPLTDPYAFQVFIKDGKASLADGTELKITPHELERMQEFLHEKAQQPHQLGATTAAQIEAIEEENPYEDYDYDDYWSDEDPAAVYCDGCGRSPENCDCEKKP